MTDLVAQKSVAREAASKVRAIAHDVSEKTAGAMISKRGRELLANHRVGIISGFYPYGSEIDTRPLLSELVLMGWTTALPIVEKAANPLIFREWKPGEDTVAGAWNIPIPADTSSLVVPDIMLVPLLSFDRKGFRLGYGGGFYDRTFAKLRKKSDVVGVGVAYAAQEVDAVPRGVHDEPLDWVLTEKELLRIG